MYVFTYPMPLSLPDRRSVPTVTLPGAAVGNGATWEHVEFLDTGHFNFFLSLRRFIRRTRKNDVCLRMHLGVVPGCSDSFPRFFISDEEH